MQLKELVNKQIYERTREPLGVTNYIDGKNFAFDSTKRWQLYSMPLVWIKKKYNFVRGNIPSGNSFEDFLSFSGDIISGNFIQVSDGISISGFTGENYVLMANLRSTNNRKAKIDIDVSADNALYMSVGLYYSGSWHTYSYDYITNIKASIAVPYNQDVILGVFLYFNSQANCNLGFAASDKIDGNEVESGFFIETPEWANDPTMTVDRARSTVGINLSWYPPDNMVSWSGNFIRRRNSSTALSQQQVFRYDDIESDGAICVNYDSIVDPYRYYAGNVLQASSISYNMDRFLFAPANYIQNGDFSSNLTNWTITNGREEALKATAYILREEPYSLDRCLYFSLLKSASLGKNLRVQYSNNIPINKSTFIYHIRSTSLSMPYYPGWNFLFKKSDLSACSTSSAFAPVSQEVASTWVRGEIRLTFPSNCAYYVPVFWASKGHTSAFNMCIDCVGAFATSGAYNPNTSYDRMYIYTNNSFTVPKNDGTAVFDRLGGNLSKMNIKGGTAYSTYTSDYHLGNKFLGGFQLHKRVNNLVSNYYTWTKTTHVEDVTFTSTGNPFTLAKHFSPSLFTESLSKSLSISPLTLGSPYNYSLSFYAKCATSDNNVYVRAVCGNRSGYVSSANFRLTNSWNRYFLNVRPTVAALTTGLSVVFRNTQETDNFYLSGIQVESTGNPQPFNNMIVSYTTKLATSYLQLGKTYVNSIYTAPRGTLLFNVAHPHRSTYISGGYENYFYQKDASGNELGIRYEYGARRIYAYYKYFGNTQASAAIPYKFNENESFMLGMVWKPTKSYIVLNNTMIETSNKFKFYYTTANFGADLTDGCNATLCNIRVDTCAWYPNKVYTQSRATMYGPASSSYGIYVYYDKTIELPRILNQNPIHYTDYDNIQPNTDYEYTLYGIDGSYIGKQSAAKAIYTLATAPLAVHSTSVAGGKDYIDFSWKETRDTDAYTDHYLVYEHIGDKNLSNLTYGPAIVPYSQNLSTVTFRLNNVNDIYYRQLKVLGVDIWGLYNTSNAVSIVGQAQPRTINRNLIENGSFEILDSFTGNMEGWHSSYNDVVMSGPVLNNIIAAPSIVYGGMVSSAYYFFGGYTTTGMNVKGGYSLKVGCTDSIGPWYTAAHVIGYNGFDPLLSKNITYSHWSTCKPGAGNSACKWVLALFYSEYGSTAFSAGSIFKLMPKQSEMGDDGRVWTRYSTTFSYSYNYNTGDKYYKGVIVAPFPTDILTGVSTAYVDGVQVEIGSLTDYQKPEYRGARYGISGNNLVQGTVGYQNFSDGMLRAGGETSGKGYVQMSAGGLTYHPAGYTHTQSYFTRTVYSGTGVFGQQINFAVPFRSYTGTALVVPHVLITPANMVTYSTAYKTTSQSFSISVNATAGGFVANAYLYKMGGAGYQDTFTSFTEYSAGASVHTVYALRQGTIDADWFRYLMAHTSRSTAGSFTFYYDCDNNLPKRYVYDFNNVSFRLYCTSNSVAFNKSTWVYIGTKEVAYTEIFSSRTVNFSNTRFNGARNFAVLLATPATGVAWYMKNNNGFTLIYNTTSQSVIKSGASMGTFNWIALNGGNV